MPNLVKSEFPNLSKAAIEFLTEFSVLDNRNQETDLTDIEFVPDDEIFPEGGFIQPNEEISTELIAAGLAVMKDGILLIVSGFSEDFLIQIGVVARGSDGQLYRVKEG